MTNDQIMGLVRQGLAILGTLATAFGWITPDKVASITATVLSIAGPLLMVAGLVWNVIANKQTSIAASLGANDNTTVKANSTGGATVTINDPAMAQAAITANKAA